MAVFEAHLTAALTAAGLPYEEAQIAKAVAFKELLIAANRNTNLTAITDESEMASKHFADSLLLLRHADLPEGATLVDIGSGPGFPGIPLKIFRPDLKIMLLESAGKKCRFLTEAVDALALKDISVYCGRAEEMGREATYRAHFQCATARAVADFAVLLEYALPLLNIGGKFFCFKGPEAEAELPLAGEALALCGGSLEKVEHYTISQTEYRRCLLTVRKTAPCGEKYPRRPGIPAKRPL